MTQAAIYALVEDGQVTLYPLSIDDINARANPAESYYLCFFNTNRPQETLTHKVIQSPIYIGTAVFVSETVETKNIDELFAELHAVATSYDEAGQPYLDRTKVSPEMYTAFLEIVRIEVQNRMDAFAKTRGYDDMKSLCNYGTSTDPIYQAEAARGIYLRDTIWRELFTYFEGIVNATEAIPSEWADIEAHYVPLTWE